MLCMYLLFDICVWIDFVDFMCYHAVQVDKFELEAVSLGALSQCLVGHDGTRSGDGWYLETIVVRDGKNNGREYVFPCNKSVLSLSQGVKLHIVMC